MLSARPIAEPIVALHDERTRAWHDSPLEAGELVYAPPASVAADEAAWLDLVAHQHRANFELWHVEDEARVPGASDAELARVKRRVDAINQVRNDLAEQIDVLLLDDLASHRLPNESAPLNSEPPSLIVDRLSILALKLYHTREEAERSDAAAGHAERNRERLAILDEQRSDLAMCLNALWEQTLAGTRRFKLYRQLKMYNDPSLNPAVYSKLLREALP